MEAILKKKRSFRDISPRDYMYFPIGTLEMGKPGQFSKLELKHIFVAMSVLTISFAFALSYNSILWSHLSNGFCVNRCLQGCLLSFLGVITAFFFHEISHKLMAQYYGLWSEFRMYPKTLLISFILSITTGFVFAVPGAVIFRGEPRPFEEGKIAMAGPLANIFLAGIFTPLFLLIYTKDLGIIIQIIGFICIINIIFAVYNLLPFGPLDGKRIIKWSPFVWITLSIIAVCLLLVLLTIDFSNYFILTAFE